MSKVPSRKSLFFATLCLTCFFVVALLSVATLRSPTKAEHRHDRPRQVDPETSCGPVSLAVVSHALGQPISIATFHKATQAGELGTCSMADLTRALRQNGFAAKAVRYDPAHPPASRLPLVLLLDGFHFVAALPRPDRRLTLIDPPSEPRVVAWPDLRDRWRGEAVVVGPSERVIEASSAVR